MEEKKSLTRAQELAWKVMTAMATLAIYLVFSERYAIADPPVAVIFVLSVLAVAFFTRKFIRDNTDENAKMKRRQKQ